MTMTRAEYDATVTKLATSIINWLPKDSSDAVLTCACIEAAVEIAIRAKRTDMVGAKFIETGMLLMQYEAEHAQAH